VNGDKVDYAMKLGEGGEAFFVFQTEGDIPEEMRTSPIVSPNQSPVLASAMSAVATLPRELT
jgi:phosphatidate phosphatase LPIN